MAKLTFKQKVVGALSGGVLAALSVTVIHFEGTRYTPYQDGGGVLTVCQGHTGGVKLGHTYTPEECDALRGVDLSKSLADADRLSPGLPDKVRVAVADFIYNLGAGAYERSTLRRKINAGEGAKACEEFLHWDHIGKVQIRGLTIRRKFEYQLCVEGFEGR